ncbi:MAG: response regulator transcription factor [Proteobacteria bacterium]|nr:response regulator transcription factor [Pseudomonadota bacterium]
MSKTVLIVDDDADVRDSLSVLLMRSEYAVKTFASAKALLDAGDPGADCCVLADVRMPEMDGLALQRELTARWPRLPVVIMTGHGDVPMAVKAMRAGAIDFLEKPFEKPALMEALKRAFALAGAPPAEAPAQKISPRQVLTEREYEVFQLLVAGDPNKIVAYKLNISVRTAEAHRANLMAKLNARNLADLVRMSFADENS